MTAPDYSYYQGTYGGVMPEEDYRRLSRRACAYVDCVTLHRVTEALAGMENVKDAVCAVADGMFFQEQGGEVVSAENDGYREQYAASGKTPEARLYEAAALYLGHTGLLYRGV